MLYRKTKRPFLSNNLGLRCVSLKLAYLIIVQMSFYSFPIHFKAKGTVPFNIVPKCEMVFKSQENAHTPSCVEYMCV